ncbi:hypothetical protein CDL15_Pgr026266 [Punica granatum]|uniref:Myb/SANT-like domain-containing protein n=1 Tax=Punica granatum TaxID=22663 RepID=A0A218XVV9_PUNGR|nr:hypothetical protein CDL15_Pgr026266 [Punica granatum]
MDSSSASVTSEVSTSGKRKWTMAEDVALISCMIDLRNMGTHNADTGFKSGYLLELEKMLLEKLPNCELEIEDLTGSAEEVDVNPSNPNESANANTPISGDVSRAHLPPTEDPGSASSGKKDAQAIEDICEGSSYWKGCSSY